MKKIVIFTEQLYGGGVERILQIICNNFNVDKYNVTIFTVRRDNLSLTYFPSHVKFKYVFETYNETSTWWEKLRCKIGNKIKLLFYYNFSPSFFYHLFIREKTDVAIAFIEGYATRLVAGFPKRVKRIAWIHTDIEINHWSKIAYRSILEEKEIYRDGFNKVICVSNTVFEKINIFSGNIKNACVVHNPIDRRLIINSSLQPAEDLVYERKERLIMSLGSLIEIKGYNRLLSVANKLKEEGYDFKLFILGDGIQREELNLFINNNDLMSFVYLLGYKENPYNYLNQCDIYVCSSYAEGYNTAITEALVLGKAVVSTDCSGVKEQLGEHNEWGICVPNSEEGLYGGLKQMLNPDTLKYYTEQATKRGKDFTLEKSMNKIYQLIEE